MAQSREARNIIVGEGRLYYAVCGTDLPTYTAETSAKSDFDGDANWTDAGFTQEGVEVSYQPDYGEVQVDQLADAAVLFRQSQTVMMNTNLVESTFQNLLVAWGLPDSDATGGDLANDGVFNIGVPDTEPVERSIVVIGRGNSRLFEADSLAAGFPPVDTVKKTERIYHAHRVVSMEGSNHSLRRSEATVFPVSFRLLPTEDQAGEEYGTITERLVEAAPPSS